MASHSFSVFHARTVGEVPSQLSYLDMVFAFHVVVSDVELAESLHDPVRLDEVEIVPGWRQD